MKTLHIIIAVIALSSGCSKKDNNDDQQNFLIDAALPSSAQLTAGVYPVGSCLPLQLQAKDAASKAPLSLNSGTVVTFAEGNLLQNSSLLGLTVFSDNQCTQKIIQVTVPASSSPTPSWVTVYIQSPSEGQTRLKISYETGNSSVGLWMPLKFQKQ